MMKNIKEIESNRYYIAESGSQEWVDDKGVEMADIVVEDNETGLWLLVSYQRKNGNVVNISNIDD